MSSSSVITANSHVKQVLPKFTSMLRYEWYQTANSNWPFHPATTKLHDEENSKSNYRPGRYIVAQCGEFTKEQILTLRGQTTESKEDSPSFDDVEPYVVVYQAYNATIAAHASQHHRFVGCSAYSPTRMTWIKTNFLWMMYRCGWCSKDANQSNVLAIFLKKSAFERYLKYTVLSSHISKYEEEEKLNQCTDINADGSHFTIRGQWDPDHTPAGGRVFGRRAIQLGLKNVTAFTHGKDILYIEDITPFVQEFRSKTSSELRNEQLIVPEERVYTCADEQTVARLGIESIYTLGKSPFEEEDPDFSAYKEKQTKTKAKAKQTEKEKEKEEAS